MPFGEIDHSIGSAQESWLVRQRDPAAEQGDDDLVVIPPDAPDEVSAFYALGLPYATLDEETKAYINTIDPGWGEPYDVAEACI